MPKVGKPGAKGAKSFPYTAKGKAAAKDYAAKTGMPMHDKSMDKMMPKGKKGK